MLKLMCQILNFKLQNLTLNFHTEWRCCVHRNRTELDEGGVRACVCVCVCVCERERERERERESERVRERERGGE